MRNDTHTHRRNGAGCRSEATTRAQPRLGSQDDDPKVAPYMFNFILKLQQSTVWMYGRVGCVKFPMDQLFVPNSHRGAKGICAKMGMSALLLVCRNKARRSRARQPACSRSSRAAPTAAAAPSRAALRSALPARQPGVHQQRGPGAPPSRAAAAGLTRAQSAGGAAQADAGIDYALEEFFPVDVKVSSTFNPPSLPGKKAPPIESMMLLARAARLRPPLARRSPARLSGRSRPARFWQRMRGRAPASGCC